MNGPIDEGEEEGVEAEVIQEEGYPEEEVEEAQSQQPVQDEEDLSVEKLVELLLLTLHLIENIRSRAVEDEEAEPRRLDAIVEMIDNFERMGESDDGKFDLNAIFQVLMQRKQEAQSTPSQAEEGVEEDQYDEATRMEMYRQHMEQQGEQFAEAEGQEEQ